MSKETPIAPNIGETKTSVAALLQGLESETSQLREQCSAALRRAEAAEKKVAAVDAAMTAPRDRFRFDRMVVVQTYDGNSPTAVGVAPGAVRRDHVGAVSECRSTPFNGSGYGNTVDTAAGELVWRVVLTGGSVYVLTTPAERLAFDSWLNREVKS